MGSGEGRRKGEEATGQLFTPTMGDEISISINPTNNMSLIHSFSSL